MNSYKWIDGNSIGINRLFKNVLPPRGWPRNLLGPEKLSKHGSLNKWYKYEIISFEYEGVVVGRIQSNLHYKKSEPPNVCILSIVQWLKPLPETDAIPKRPPMNFNMSPNCFEGVFNKNGGATRTANQWHGNTMRINSNAMSITWGRGTRWCRYHQIYGCGVGNCLALEAQLFETRLRIGCS